MIHQIRNTTKFVSYKEIKPFMADLKRVYAAPTEEIAWTGHRQDWGQIHSQLEIVFEERLERL